MVFRASKNVWKKTTTSTSTKRSIERSCRKVESTRNAEFTVTSGLDSLRQNLLAEEISERASSQTIVEHFQSSMAESRRALIIRSTRTSFIVLQP